MITIPMRVSVSEENIPMVVSASSGIVIPSEISVAIEVSASDVYTGEYTVVPETNEIVLETKNKFMTDDVTVERIPRNYGLITWNGSILTVS